MHDTMRHEWNINELSVIGRYYSESVPTLVVVATFLARHQIPFWIKSSSMFAILLITFVFEIYQDPKIRITELNAHALLPLSIFECILSNSVNQKFIVMEKIKCDYYAIYVLFVFTILKIIIMWAMWRREVMCVFVIRLFCGRKLINCLNNEFLGLCIVEHWTYQR